MSRAELTYHDVCIFSESDLLQPHHRDGMHEDLRCLLGRLYPCAGQPHLLPLLPQPSLPFHRGGFCTMRHGDLSRGTALDNGAACDSDSSRAHGTALVLSY